MAPVSHPDTSSATPPLGQHSMLDVPYFRRFVAMTDEEVQRLDASDCASGCAMHHRDLVADAPRKSWRMDTQAELVPGLHVRPYDGDIWQTPDETELQQWSKLGMLPPGKARVHLDWTIANVCRDISGLENRLKG